MSRKNFKEQSKFDWSRTDELPASNEQLSVGCLQHIADATELMAKNYKNLIDERDKYERWYKQERAEKESLQRSTIAHKANYTRLKNKYDAAKTKLEISDGIIADLQKREGWQNHLPTCGTAFRGCDPNCPKELHEKKLEATNE